MKEKATIKESLVVQKEIVPPEMELKEKATTKKSLVVQKEIASLFL